VSAIPKLKVEDDELDIDALEEAEEGGGDFEPYDGPQPPKGTILVGYVKKVWWTYTKNEDPMLKILFVAADNVGSKAKYNDCPIWENAALIPGAKFRWAPFLRVMGLTLRQLKTKTQIEAEPENNGDPIIKIDRWAPGSDESWCRVLTDREKYDDEWQTRIGKWLEYEEPEAEDEAEEDDEEVDTEDETDEEPEDDEEEEEAAPPARTRAARTARGSAGRRAAPAKTPAATPTRGGRRQPAASKATATKAATTKPASRGRGRGKAAGSDDDPPF
jgi:hypothetical protein